MPTTTVKDQAQAHVLGVPIGTVVPIFVPSSQNPQTMVNQWSTPSWGNNPVNFQERPL
jgi:hypothetical protein